MIALVVDLHGGASLGFTVHAWERIFFIDTSVKTPE